ncbi:MAG: molybdopterin-guanine dinucleotide biosynthesis protein B [Rhodospirillales bacterium]|nr:molybdopterin-guanine dinucleotide biosynthesis protein B [Rhodospirillales bacterium]
MKVFGLVGWSGSGKTTLIKSLIPEITGRGFTVSTMKHTHHKFDIDKPGKDSYEHRQAGATEVMVVSDRRWALMHETRDEPIPSMEELITKIGPVDLLLIEGFKSHAHIKMEVFRPSLGKEMRSLEDDSVVAIASDEDVLNANRPVLDLNNVPAVADFILDQSGLKKT